MDHKDAEIISLGREIARGLRRNPGREMLNDAEDARGTLIEMGVDPAEAVAMYVRWCDNYYGR